jgi:hypothetical protein
MSEIHVVVTGMGVISPVDQDVVLSNSFGFGGHNTVLVFRAFRPGPGA